MASRRLVEIVCTRADQDITAYMTIRLSSVRVSGSSISSTGDRPTEKVTLNFAAIELKESTQETDGSSVAPYVFRWDLAKQMGG